MMVSTNHTPFLERQAPGLSDEEPVPYRERLVERAKAGDADAFARLYDLYVDQVYDYMYFHVAAPQTAEDLTARVFLKAWRNFGCYEPGRPALGAWLYLIARHAVIEFRRSQRQELGMMEILSPEDEGLAAYKLIGPCSGAADEAPIDENASA